MIERKVSILIPNLNSFEAVQLAVESIAFYTRHSNYDFIVYDDCSTNDMDVSYLREAKRRGWITELIEGKKHIGHGAALNILLNEVCDSDLAMVVDCDVQIKGVGWLRDMTSLVTQDDILGVCNFRHEMLIRECYCAGFYRMWFGLLNMHAYRDGMQVDWRYAEATREHEPFKSMFMCLDGIPRPKGFNENLVKMDPGSKLWVKVRYENPKGYRMIHIPGPVLAKFHHYGHISMISIPDPRHSDQVRINRETRFKKIREELGKLRCRY